MLRDRDPNLKPNQIPCQQKILGAERTSPARVADCWLLAAKKRKDTKNVKNQHNKVRKTMKMHSPGPAVFTFLPIIFLSVLGKSSVMLHKPGCSPARHTHVSGSWGQAAQHNIVSQYLKRVTEASPSM